MFSSTPVDVQSLIHSQLSFSDIGAMHQVSKAQNDIISNNASEKERREQIFKDRFGAFASQENTQEIRNHVARRYHRLKELSHAEPTHILKFDNGMPILVNPANQPEKISWWQQIKGRYLQWRLESPDENVNKEIRKIFNEHVKVLNDLFTRPLDKEQPLQDYRDRMMRRQTILEERCFILNLLGSFERRTEKKRGLDRYWTSNSQANNRNTYFKEGYLFKKDSLPFQIEHIAFAVFFMLHRLVSPRLHSLSLPRYRDSVLHKNCEIEIGKTTLSFENKSIPVKIIAIPQIDLHETINEGSGRHGPASFGWNINLVDENQRDIGKMSTTKTWRLIKSEVSEGLFYKPGILSDPALKITIHQIESERNSQTGDLPIERIMTQLAVEIFDRGSDQKLKINCGFGNPIRNVLTMGGFSSVSWGNLQKIYREIIIKNRQTKNKLFEGYDRIEVRRADTWILNKKLNSSSNGETKFFGSDSGGDDQPAYVEYKMDGSKSTWENTIAAQPLLSGKGPLLPKFWERDLSKQM